jgi:ubiquinone/menaquinone biosynthesis C-methylase UbiE
LLIVLLGEAACRRQKRYTEIMPAVDPTQRFSSRVDNYVRYRPGYPTEILELLRTECGLTPQTLVADVASGTGIWTRVLLENGNPVIGVEPNNEMRNAAERELAGYANFTSVIGTAEATTLADHLVDMVTAAQAAHWFDREKARREFKRILKPKGWIVLIWNERQTDSTPFLREYEQLLLNYGTDYGTVRHERTTDEIGGFFGPIPYREHVFESKQEFDYAALEGRLLSSSYTPQEGSASYAPMLRDLRQIFDAHQRHGQVAFDYNTRVYCGRVP